MWLTSLCGKGAGGECIECALMDGGAVVRGTGPEGGHRRKQGSGCLRDDLVRGHPVR